MDLTESDAERFWQKVERGPDCWEYQGYTGTRGYGRFKVGGKIRQAHRVSYRLVHGAPDSPLVLHECDNRSCVNPDHLYAGTYSDNLRDAYERDRRDGVKLTAEDVDAIRQSDESSTELAERFGVSRSHVANIRAGRRR